MCRNACITFLYASVVNADSDDDACSDRNNDDMDGEENYDDYDDNCDEIDEEENIQSHI